MSFSLKTGFDNSIQNSQNDKSIFLKKIETMMLILLEKSMFAAINYMKAAKRNTLTSQDIRLGMIYECHEFMNHDDLEIAFHNKFNEDSSDEEDENDDEYSSVEEVDDDNEPFTNAADGINDVIDTMNKYESEWNEWVPKDPLQIHLKQAIVL